jgi:cobalt-zinc-cadmium efflux system outer membrane protein
MLKTLIPLFLVVSIVGAVHSPAHSMTLDETVGYGLAQNPDLKVLRLEENIVKSQLEKAKLFLIANPTLGGDLSRKDRPPEGGKGVTDYLISISQEFEIAGQRGLRIDIAKKNLSRILLEIKDRERILSSDIKDAFVWALTAKKREDLAKEVVRLQEELLGYTKVKFQAGDVSALQVNLAEVEMSKARRDLLEAGREYREALLTLQRAMGAKPDLLFSVEGDITPDSFPLPDRESLKALAASQRPDLKAASFEIEAAKDAVVLVRKEAVPNITLGGYIGKDERRSDVGLAVSIPIPIIDRRQAERKEAMTRAEQARIRRAGLERAIEREFEATYSNLRSSLDQIAIYKKEIVSRTLENLGLLNLAFKEGKIGFFDVRVAQKESIDIQFSYLETMLKARRAMHAMERAVGGELK